VRADWSSAERNIDSASSPRAAAAARAVHSGTIRRDFGGSRNPGIEALESSTSDHGIPLRAARSFGSRGARRRVNLVSRLAAAIYSTITAPELESTRNSGRSSRPCLDDGQILMRNLSRGSSAITRGTQRSSPDRFSHYYSSRNLPLHLFSRGFDDSTCCQHKTFIAMI